MSDEPTKEEIEDFLKGNDVDERAAADLRDCPPDVQRRALARGDLSSARNPSAALLARIRDARVEVRGGGSGGIYMGGSGVGLPSTKAIEDFITNNKISDSAAKTLRDSSPTVKRVVLACGRLSGNQDPSSELLARIRAAPQDVKAGGSGWTGGGVGLPSSQDVEDFIKDNDVDGRAAADLRDLPPALQRAVLVRGDLRSARNPSSALIARIRDAKLGVPGGPGGSGDGSMQEMPPGGYPFPGYGAPMPGMPPGYPPPGYGMYPGAGYPGGWYPGYPGFPGPGGYPGYPGYPGPGGYGGYPGYPPGQGGYGSGDPHGGAGPSHGKSKGRSCSRSCSSSYSRSYSRSRSRSRGRGKSPPRALPVRKGRSRRR
uniref:Uncharacterized protein n=1 Tax=Alexandrium catenella TaxID=2925 RepID=A0A7S1RH06_ALECA|mmetsp:Transcript_58392/g.156291  ORF Transcript_58392/g.156291 Transcript_58392/m.156291 type:complete len:371 (+) Transcript_58392:69-1181(+)